MRTPVYDFLRRYAARDSVRAHMPGHKGRGVLGCEALDITEIPGADSLYEADGILAQSEENAASLFGAGRTFYSAGGSSQCVRAMLHLAVQRAGRRTVLCARNAHKSFLYAAALLDLNVQWLWPEDGYELLRCRITARQLEAALQACKTPPAAVYVTSPDYLGTLQPIAELAAVCRRRGVPLLVDNAHGAYLHFLLSPQHPLDLGASLCCDSAHKTLPVLTGGAYLHLAKGADFGSDADIRQALALFGSTSPSYLILASLDLCNAWLDGPGRAELQRAAEAAALLKAQLAAEGWAVADGEPLKLTVRAAEHGLTGTALAQTLRQRGVECEYADHDDLTLMFSGSSTAQDFARTRAAFPPCPPKAPAQPVPALAPPKAAMSIRQALFAPSETVSVCEAEGRICAAPTVSCPPAVPVVVSGEVIGRDAVAVFSHYGIRSVCVVK